ncbi:MAG: phosphosulfolactate synthase [Actinomycetota bacterium]|nr:phosphosulfolactate synthase [Actinomycetota bacterium]
MTAPERSFSFLRTNRRQRKPRTRGITEIRGPYYTVMGPRYLHDVLETMGEYADILKFAGGSFTLLPRPALKQIIDIAHEHGVLVSTGGFIEFVLTQGPEAVDRYIDECRNIGFDIVEVSSGFITLPTDDFVRLTEKVNKAGLKAKPEVGIQFGAGGATSPEELEQEGTKDVGWAINMARRCLDAGAHLIMIESEGITEEVRSWRTDVVSDIVSELGLEHVMFEAADPAVFDWYVKNYGPDVNLFVDHSQIVQLECLRQGIWGTKSVWGRVLTYEP